MTDRLQILPPVKVIERELDRAINDACTLRKLLEIAKAAKRREETIVGKRRTRPEEQRPCSQ